jgi:type III secretory pathway component EscS
VDLQLDLKVVIRLVDPPMEDQAASLLDRLVVAPKVVILLVDRQLDLKVVIRQVGPPMEDQAASLLDRLVMAPKVVFLLVDRQLDLKVAIRLVDRHPEDPVVSPIHLPSVALKRVDLQLDLKMVIQPLDPLQVDRGLSHLDLLVVDLDQVINPLDLLSDLKEVTLLVVPLPEVLVTIHLEYLTDFLLDHRAAVHKLLVLPVHSPLSPWVELLRVEFLMEGHKGQELSRMALVVVRVVFQAELVVSLVDTVTQAKRHTRKETILLFLVSLVLIIQYFLRYHQHLSDATSSDSLDIMPMWRHGAKFSTFVPTTRLTTFCVLMALCSISNISSVCGGINLTATAPLVYSS